MVHKLNNAKNSAQAAEFDFAKSPTSFPSLPLAGHMVALESLTTKASWQKSSGPIIATISCEDQQTDPSIYSLLIGRSIESGAYVNGVHRPAEAATLRQAI